MANDGTAAVAVGPLKTRIDSGFDENGAPIAERVRAKTLLGQVATRTRVPSAFVASAKNVMSRHADFIRENLTGGFRLVFANFYTTSTGEASPGASCDITCAVEYPAGVFTRVTFGGLTTGTMLDGQEEYVSDNIALNPPFGAQIWVHTWRSSAAGLVLNNLGYRASVGDQVSYGTTVADVTGAAWTGTGAGYCYRPTAIIAETNRPVVAGLGDSRAEGAGDAGGQIASAAFVGEIAPGVAPYFAYLDLSRSSQRVQHWANGGFAKRAVYLKYANVGIMGGGINDMAGGARTAAQVLADRATVRAFAPLLKWFDCTVSPYTFGVTLASLTSSGTTATATFVNADQAAAVTVGQTYTITDAGVAGYNGSVVITGKTGLQVTYTLLAGASGLAASTGPTGYFGDGWKSLALQSAAPRAVMAANRPILNDALRLGQPGVFACFDLSDGVESSRNSGLWAVPPQTPAPATDDGLHGNLVTYIATARAFNPALIWQAVTSG